MRILALRYQQVRNLYPHSLEPHPLLNVFVGHNGAGKTSLLEAIHLLGLGRSFRAQKIHHVVTHDQRALVVFGQITDDTGITKTLGIEKTREGETRYQVGGEPCSRLTEFAAQLPLQMITPDTFHLLTGGPQERRHYLDWGVFHVEHSFGEAHQRYQRLLKQRNALLKQAKWGRAFDAQGWDLALVAAAEAISQMRKRHFEALKPILLEILSELLPQIDLDIRIAQGWPETLSMAEALTESQMEDRRVGYTRWGPHRADLIFTCGANPAGQTLSRGQQKQLICGLHLGQAQLLQQAKGRRCLFLLDDLASELDALNRKRLLESLLAGGYQCFITDVTPENWTSWCEAPFGAMFHVEQGRVGAQKPTE